MSTLEKFLVAAVGLAVVTTAVLPGRQTPAVINSIAGLLKGVIGTAMGATSVPK